MPTGRDTKIVTLRFGNEDAKTLAGYEKTGGYQVLRKALAMRPEDITAEVKASNLRGRGGAGFATGVKWGFVPANSPKVHLVCNADESEPGTCKDRELMYWDPHLLIEGMVIAAHALRDARLGHGRLATGPSALGVLGFPLTDVLVHGWISVRDVAVKDPIVNGAQRTVSAVLELTEPRCRFTPSDPLE